MKRRCLNPKSSNYHLYGGRGITVCQQWQDSFESFYLDMGQKPSTKHTIDRIDNNGNYEPSNCKWSTPKEQCSNKRKYIGKVYLNCSVCGKQYIKKRSCADNSKYCSINCLFIGRQSRVSLSCLRCGTRIVRITSQSIGNIFCSNNCSNRHKVDKKEHVD